MKRYSREVLAKQPKLACQEGAEEDLHPALRAWSLLSAPHQSAPPLRSSMARTYCLMFPGEVVAIPGNSSEGVMAFLQVDKCEELGSL